MGGDLAPSSAPSADSKLSLGAILNRSNKTAVLVLGGWADLGQCPGLSKNVWSHFYPFVGLHDQPFVGRLPRVSSGGHSRLKIQGHSFPQRAVGCPRGLHFQQTVVSGPNPSSSSGRVCKGHQRCQLFPLVRLPGEAGLAGAPSQEGGRGLGVSCLFTRGQALLSKQLCHQVTAGGTLWLEMVTIGHYVPSLSLGCPCNKSSNLPCAGWGGFGGTLLQWDSLSQ